MAKVLKEDKVFEVDLNNLTKDDFMQMAHYIQHLEEQLDGCKSTGIALVGQRNVLQKKVEQMAFMLNNKISEKPINTIIDTDFDLINPEQYRIKQ